MTQGKTLVLLPSVLEDDGDDNKNEGVTQGGVGSRPPSEQLPPPYQHTVTWAEVDLHGQTGRHLHSEGTVPEKVDEEEEDGGEEDEEERICVITDEAYDTDLELEDDRKSFDPTGHMHYLEACRMFQEVPASYFLRNMQNSELFMMHHGLGPKGAKALAVSLVTNISILKMNLQDNWMEGIGGAAIAEMLKENCFITEVDLSDNRLGEDGASAMAGMLLENDTLVSLNLSGNRMRHSGAQHLSQALTRNTRLKTLDLSHNALGEPTGEILGACLSENTGLRSLNLAWNCLRGRDAVVCAMGLGANVFLRSLDLSYNGFGTEGAHALGEALKENNTLEELNISNNCIPPEGAIRFAMGLKVNKTIKCLNMTRNPMQSAGCYGILKAIQGNPGAVIEMLDFSTISVNQHFEDLYNTVKEMFPNLAVNHGGVIGKFRRP